MYLVLNMNIQQKINKSLLIQSVLFKSTLDSKIPIIIKLIFILSILCTLLWTQLWGNNPDHRLGDSDLVAVFQYAARGLLNNGSETSYLAKYSIESPVYTHLTTGPEYLQVPIAALHQFLSNFFQINSFYFHSFLTAVANLIILFWGLSNLFNFFGKIFNTQVSNTNAILITILILTGANTQVFAPHPFSLGMTLSDSIAIWVCVKWTTLNISLSKKILLSCISVFISFWMGLVPIPSAVFWVFAGAHAFSNKENRTIVFSKLFISLILTGIVCLSLKLFQNYTYFKSWETTLQDALYILKYRQGLVSDYSIGTHLLKLLWRGFYLYGFGTLLAIYYLVKFKHCFSQIKSTLFILFFAAFGWHLFMRNHSFHHIYMFRSLGFPLFFIILSGLHFTKMTDKNKIYLISTLTALQLILLWAFALIPSLLK